MDCGACVCTRARAHSCRAVNVLKVPARRTCAVRTRSRGSKSARSICWTKQAAPRKAAPVTRRHAGCAPSTGRTDSALSSGAAPPWSAADSAKSTVRTPTLLLRGRCPESHASAVCKRVCAVREVSLPLWSLPRCLSATVSLSLALDGWRRRARATLHVLCAAASLHVVSASLPLVSASGLWSLPLPLCRSLSMVGAVVLELHCTCAGRGARTECCFFFPI